MCFSWEMFWNALSAIGTIGAVITALFIIKWQDKINQRKKVKIEWKHMKGQIVFDVFQDDEEYDSIFINFVNTGNRKVIIEQIKFLFKDGSSYGYTHLIATTETDMTLPCKLEIEDAKNLKIPRTDFRKFVQLLQKSNAQKLNEKVVIVAEDTSGKEYACRTGVKYSDYLL